MGLLSVAVAILAVLVLLDLVLSAVVIRRLRAAERQLIEITTPSETGLVPGESMPDFVSADGRLSRADLVGKPSLVGFFADNCRHCPPEAERLVERADEIADRGVAVVSVIGTSDDGSDDLIPLLRKAGRLVIEGGSGELKGAFRAGATPTLLMFDDAGVLVASSPRVDELLGGE
jgi:thiol-disulfide isomerase/thioredoxin